MGYYTAYSLEILENGDENLIKELRENNTDARYALTEDGNTEATCKWYDASSELMEFSKKYPSTLFKLSGIGEDPDDRRCEYFKNRKSQRCKATIIFPEFDETLLK